jgi:hypothetical protein
MSSITTTPPAPVVITEPSSAIADHLLRHLHVAHLRAALIDNEITTITTALRAGWIDGATALSMLEECGLSLGGSS